MLLPTVWMADCVVASAVLPIWSVPVRDMVGAGGNQETSGDGLEARQWTGDLEAAGAAVGGAVAQQAQRQVQVAKDAAGNARADAAARRRRLDRLAHLPAQLQQRRGVVGH